MQLQFSFCEWCGKTGQGLKLYRLTVETPRGNDDTFAICGDCASDEYNSMCDARNTNQDEWADKVFGDA